MNTWMGKVILVLGLASVAYIGGESLYAQTSGGRPRRPVPPDWTIVNPPPVDPDPYTPFVP